MSHSPMVATIAHPYETSSDDTTVAESDLQHLLDALGDADCRAILEATSTEALTANEVSETCNLPLSTAYRKLEKLTDSRLVEERTRIRQSGKHASEYSRVVESVSISVVTGEGMRAAVSRGERSDRITPSAAVAGRFSQ